MRRRLAANVSRGADGIADRVDRCSRNLDSQNLSFLSKMRYDRAAVILQPQTHMKMIHPAIRGGQSAGA
jgi:hypothetical protein